MATNNVIELNKLNNWWNKIRNWLREIIDPIKREYIKKGYKQVEKYDWLKAAQITLDVFNNAI